ncbi:chloramphenicol acetyltransferase [Pseudoalteromonas citrea]|uniref:Chloramphenicol acetyltransferase n=1 Tax=Pseudoalteromonas citrea TaxID=43655 RepID=A0A5S3XNV6_9GAMM|nr:CatA-like O-acetyltransferase [Pseudoalteromonas citrea]TMP42410.1 chloramphenicol acetyltransferase [Pseudoalteromonas citrea]TMP58771.1 chloramphenicol acetyltransferase [Pseudoalteromonas citrea]
MKMIDKTSWSRSAHFAFYKEFEQPNFNVTVELQVGRLHEFAKRHKVSFTHCYLYCLSQAIETYEPIRYRITDDEVIVTETVTLSTVFLKEDETFRFVPLEVYSDIFSFARNAQLSKEAHLKMPLLNDVFLSRARDLNQVYVSILPWFSFTSFSHAVFARSQDSGIPKFVFGKFNQEIGTIPLNIEVHHGLMDGVHVAKLITEIENQILKIIKNKVVF